MLRAPKKPGFRPCSAQPTEDANPEALASVLLGAVPEPSLMPILHSNGQDSEDKCVARTQKTTRCRNTRTHGCFCKKHFEEARSQKYIGSIFETFPAGEAARAWEKAQTEMAIQLSLEESQELQNKENLALQKIDSRLVTLGLKRVPMPRLGACQFESIVYSGLLPMTSLSLRLAAVEYLRPLGRMFADRMEGPFRGRYDSYINFMMQESSWG